MASMRNLATTGFRRCDRKSGSPVVALPNTRAGIALLEILVALLILSGGMVLVLRASHNVLRALQQSRESMRTGLLLRERIGRAHWMAVREPEALPAFDSGWLAGSLGDYAWRLETGVAGFQAESSPPLEASGRLMEIRVQLQRRFGEPATGAAAGWVYAGLPGTAP